MIQGNNKDLKIEGKSVEEREASKSRRLKRNVWSAGRGKRKERERV
jgi:hypothetical protein